MNKSDLSHIRRDYMGGPLRKGTTPEDPLELFHQWFEQISSLDPDEANAMILATATPDGMPSVRAVLLKGYSQDGFTFYTNYNSRKGRELDSNPRGALLFYWPEPARQVRIEGTVSRISPEESDSYFSSRPRGSQLSALASEQSRPIANRDVLTSRLNELEAAYLQASPPRPAYWGGYLVSPSYYEFWQGQPDRLHDRICYRQSNEGQWWKQRLAP